MNLGKKKLISYNIITIFFFVKLDICKGSIQNASYNNWAQLKSGSRILTQLDLYMGRVSSALCFWTGEHKPTTKRPSFSRFLIPLFKQSLFTFVYREKYIYLQRSWSSKLENQLFFFFFFGKNRSLSLHPQTVTFNSPYFSRRLNCQFLGFFF